MSESPLPFPAPSHPRFTFIDLFAGIGGFRLALQNLGGRCVFSSEIDRQAIRTYHANFGDIPAGDITQIDAKDIPDHDVLTAGFPCPSFSTLGQRKGFEDPRGKLFFEVVRILRIKRPKAFLLENVKGLIFHSKGRTFATMLSLLEDELGYVIPTPQILNAQNFGVPQRRERVFIVGFRADLGVQKDDFKYPDSTDSTKRMKDILEKGPVHSKYYLSSSLAQHYKIRENTTFYRQYLTDNDIARTLTAHCDLSFVVGPQLTDFTPPSRRFKSRINRESIRRLTSRERARLQGFPETFRIVVSDTSARKQFGNAVTVSVVQAIATKMMDLLCPKSARKGT